MKASKEYWRQWSKNRYLIESLFGSVKLKMGSHFRLKNEEIAQKRGLAVFVLYNMCLLASLLCVYLCL